MWRETEGDADLRRRAFQGLRKYQDAVRPPPPPAAPVFAAAGNARLLRYGAASGRAPVVFVPSLINPPQVLDISESQSLLRTMTGWGHDAYLVDWGAPAMSDATLDLAGHVTEKLAPMLAALPRPPVLVGYCLGGSLVLGATSMIDVAAVATIAAPWRFDGFTDREREAILSLWRGAKPVCERLGYTPMEVLQSGFWSLDPARTIRKFAAFLDMPPGSDKEHAFLAVEDWANGGPPLSFAAARDLFELFYAANATGAGQWIVEGKPVSTDALPFPSLSIRSSTDRIVPAAAAPELQENRTLSIGHVGMIVGSQARELLWKPLSDWLSSHGG